MRRFALHASRSTLYAPSSRNCPLAAIATAVWDEDEDAPAEDPAEAESEEGGAAEAEVGWRRVELLGDMASDRSCDEKVVKRRERERERGKKKVDDSGASKRKRGKR